MSCTKDFTYVKAIKILFYTFVRRFWSTQAKFGNHGMIFVFRGLKISTKIYSVPVLPYTKDYRNSSQDVNLYEKHHVSPLGVRRDISDLMFLIKIALNGLSLTDSSL